MTRYRLMTWVIAACLLMPTGAAAFGQGSRMLPTTREPTPDEAAALAADGEALPAEEAAPAEEEEASAEDDPSSDVDETEAEELDEDDDEDEFED